MQLEILPYYYKSLFTTFFPQGTLRDDSCNGYEHPLKNLKGEQSQIGIAF